MPMIGAIQRDGITLWEVCVMVGAVSFSPYVSSHQYTGGYARGRASAQNMQVQAGAGAAPGGRIGGVSSLIGASSIAAAGQVSGVAAVSAGRAADPESPGIPEVPII